MAVQQCQCTYGHQTVSLKWLKYTFYVNYILPQWTIKSFGADSEKNQSIQRFWRGTGLMYISLGVSETKNLSWDFPGGPTVKTPSSQCRGPGLDPWLGN